MSCQSHKHDSEYDIFEIHDMMDDSNKVSNELNQNALRGYIHYFTLFS